MLIGQKKPLEPKHVWSIRVRLEIAQAERDLAIFNRHLARILSIASGAPYAESALLLGQKLPGASGGYIHPEHLIEHLRPFMQAFEERVFAARTERLLPPSSGALS